MTKDELYEQHLQEVVGIRDIDNYPEKDVERVLDRLLQCLPNNGKLYKYRSIEGQSFDYAYDGLEKGYLWVAQAKTLNDDLDCTLIFDPIKEVEEMRKDFLKRPWFYLDNWVRANMDRIQWKHPNNFRAYHKVIRCLDKETGQLDEAKAVNTLVRGGAKKSDAEKYMQELRLLIDREIAKHAEELKKPLSSVMKFNEINREDVYVFSVTETYDCDQMWAYYGNSNNGFCIEYDFNKIKQLPFEKKRQFMFFYKVVYKEVLDEFSFKTLNEFMFSGQQNKELLNKANIEVKEKLITKTINWQHEKEWRLCLHNLDENNKLLVDLVSGIIIDERALKTENAEKLIGLANERNWTIKIRKKNYTGTKHIYEQLKAE